jgi:hypothetical protein
VRNNPLRYTDATGHFFCCFTGDLSSLAGLVGLSSGGGIVATAPDVSIDPGFHSWLWNNYPDSFLAIVASDSDVQAPIAIGITQSIYGGRAAPGWAGAALLGAEACVLYCVDAIGAIGSGVRDACVLCTVLSDADERSLDDPDSLKGVTKEEVEDLIPDAWNKGPTRTEGGLRAFRPGTRNSEGIRIMPGNPAASDPLHRGPRVIITKGGHKWVIPLKGNPTLK